MTSLAPRLDQLERNLILNGNFDIWQRSTTTLITTSQFVADRFRTFNNGTFASVATASQSSDVPTVAQSGYQSKFSLLLTKTGGAITPAAADYIYHSHKIEGSDYQQIHGSKNIRIQFWVKSSIAGIYTVGLGNSNISRGYAAEYTILAVNTWEKKTIDIITDSTGTWNFDSNAGLELGFSLAIGSNYRISPGSWTPLASLGIAPASTNQVNWAGSASSTTFYLSQIMLIPQNFTLPGSTNIDIPFRRAGQTVGHELQMCQRFCFVQTSNGNTGAELLAGWSPTTTSWTGRYQFPVTMRGTPTFSTGTVAGDWRIDDTVSVTNLNAAPTLNHASVDYALIAATTAGSLTAFRPCYLASNSGANANFKFEAEI